MKKKYLELTKDDYINALKEHIYFLQFEKVNGDLREMITTLREDLLPKTIKEAINEALDTPKHKQSSDTVSCFDLNNEAWRSFRISNVLVFKKAKHKVKL